MNQYCYNIETDLEEIDSDKLKNYISNLYRRKKFDSAFDKDENLPFIVLYSEKDKQVCIKMTSRAKKNVERIEDIHKKLRAPDLKFTSEIKLSKPFLFELQQCAWWDEECKINQGQKWTSLSHRGPYFTHLLEPYEPHGAPIIYEGKRYKLSPKEERIANFYARRIISEDSGNVTQKWTKDAVFNKNFWNDFKSYLSPEHKKIFKDFSKMKFTPIVKKLTAIKESEKDLTAAQKQAKKVKAAEKKQNYGFAMINGIREPLGNFTIEPAAIFYGRGDNPKRGKIKRDIEPEEVIINIGKGEAVPTPPAGHKWQKVIHDQTLAWVASWKDPISGENKYVYFAAEGQLKGKSDFFKYEKARKLNKYIDKIREKYTKDIDSRIKKVRQLGTVLYLIDNHGIRVGGEKDETETDTVGASTLRVEHVKLKQPNIVIFDFLGKDSIQYYKEIPVDDNVYKNFQDFMSKKKPSDQLFDLISAADINDYLKTFDKDFSAKVFRTRLASTVMDTALKKSRVKKTATQDDKKKIFTTANVEVAKLLNHQRTVSEKAKETIKKYQAELRDLNKQLKDVKASGKSTTALENRIKNKKNQIENKKNTLNVAINTSLTNYIDPRLVVAWSKKNEMNIPKAYTATLQRKFKWAIDMTEGDWDYITTPLAPEMAKLQPADPSIKTPAPAKKGKKRATPKGVKRVSPVVTQLKAPAVGVYIHDYSPRSIVVLGNTALYKNLLTSLGGRYNPNLTVDGEKKAGWIFSKNKLSEVEQALLIEMKTVDEPELIALTPTVKKASEYKQSQISDEGDIKIIDYSPNEVVAIGKTKKYIKEFKSINGKFRKELTIFSKKSPGWLFPKSKLNELKDIFKEDDEESSEPVDIDLNKKEKNVIICFGRNKDAVNFLKKEFANPTIAKEYYDKDLIARFMACLDSFKQNTNIQTSKINEYKERTFLNLTKDLTRQLKPRSVEIYLFLTFLLLRSEDGERGVLINKLMSYLTHDEQCLCDNPVTKDMDSNYLLPTGKCKSIKDLILYIKESEELPTDVFVSGWEARQLLERIEKYDIVESAQIKKEIEKMLEDYLDELPIDIITMIKELYPILHFSLADPKTVRTLLNKHLKESEAERIANLGTGPALKNLRDRLAMELAKKIEKLPAEEQKAFYFVSEYVGYGQKAWGNVSVGNFCPETLGKKLKEITELSQL